MWTGAQCTAELSDGSRRVVDHLQRFENAAHEVVYVKQGEENGEFWECIGGEGDVEEVPGYNREYSYSLPGTPVPAQLGAAQSGDAHSQREAMFYCFKDPGWEKYDTFDDEDLKDDGIYILSVPQHLWVWIGTKYKGKGEGGVAADVDGYAVVRRFKDDMALPQDGDVTVIKQVEQESDEFLSYFN